MILLSSYGISTYVIALLIPMARNNVAKRIRRFNTEGIGSLKDRPLLGRPRRAGPEEGSRSAAGEK